MSSDLISRKKICDYIKGKINPYGKPFEGTAYELGLKIMRYINAMDSAYSVDKVIGELELHSFEFGTDTLPAHYVRLNEAIEIVKQKSENFGTDTNVGSNGNGILKFANLLKELCCKKDEDYDNPVISPKYLNDTIENLLLDYTEQYTNGWQVGDADDVCEWRCDAYERWHTRCNILADNDPLEYTYCPYCGKKIKIVGD